MENTQSLCSGTDTLLMIASPFTMKNQSRLNGQHQKLWTLVWKHWYTAESEEILLLVNCNSHCVNPTFTHRTLFITIPHLKVQCVKHGHHFYLKEPDFISSSSENEVGPQPLLSHPDTKVIPWRQGKAQMVVMNCKTASVSDLNPNLILYLYSFKCHWYIVAKVAQSKPGHVHHARMHK